MDICRERYYRAFVTIDLDAIYKNVENILNRTKKGTKVIAVIKTDGYGHGAIPIARTIDNLVSAYGVATVDEAVNLRKHNITKPIYVIGYTHESQLDRMIENNIRPTVFTYDMAMAVNEVAKKHNRIANIHIKLDTGMSRIGFKDDTESIRIIKKISDFDNINIEGIFTHFAKADEEDKEATYIQLERFTKFVKKLEEDGINIPIKHCSNSAAIMELQECNLDAVRAGIAMYGLYPSDEVDKDSVKLYPALGLKSHIVYIKEIEEGTAVSYGGTFIADKKMKVATIPLGYGDGYRRSLSNKGYVLINGKKANILGKVCMDQLIGKSGDKEITVEELASLAEETFNYEIVCDLGKRIPRVFYRNGKIIGTKDYFEDRYDF